MVFRKRETPFATALDAARRSAIEDATYSQLSAKWLGSIDIAAESSAMAIDPGLRRCLISPSAPPRFSWSARW